MRCKSEETMEQIKNAVEEFYFSHYRSPSIGEIAAEVGRSKSTVHSYLWEMDKLGLLILRRQNRRNRCDAEGGCGCYPHPGVGRHLLRTAGIRGRRL